MNDVTKDLLKAMRIVAQMAEDLKKPCGTNPESPQAIRNSQYMNISYAARAAIARAEAAKTNPTGEGRLAMAEMITLFCLGNGELGCDGCQREKDWQTLNQLPDSLRLAIQGQAKCIDDTVCILAGRPLYKPSTSGD